MGATFGSVVLTESPDHSGPRATVTGATLTGNDILWTLDGCDLSLQTHTAGLRDFTRSRSGAATGSWVTVLAAHDCDVAHYRRTWPTAHWYGLARARHAIAPAMSAHGRAERRIWVP